MSAKFSEDFLDDSKTEKTSSGLNVLVTEITQREENKNAMEALIKTLGIQPSMVAPVHQLSSATAKDLVDNHGWSFQRDEDPKKVHQYKKEILNGQWMGITPIALAVLPNGEIWMYDGQHRCASLAKAGEENPNVTISVVFIVVPCKDDDEIRKLYDNVDNKMASRKTKDFNKSHAIMPSLKDIAETQANTLYDGIVKATLGFRSVDPYMKHKDFTRKKRVLVGEQDFISFYYPRVKKMLRNPLVKEGAKFLRGNSDVIACMFFLWKQDEALARQFIIRITENNSTDYNKWPNGHDPIASLVSWLNYAKDKKIRGTGTLDWVHVISMAWNAFAKATSPSLSNARLPGGAVVSKNLSEIVFNNATYKDKDGKEIRETPTPKASELCFIGTFAGGSKEFESIATYRKLVGEDIPKGKYALVDLTPTTYEK